jgi:hypothetical protein
MMYEPIYGTTLCFAGSLPEDDPELYRKLDTEQDKYCIGSQIVSGGSRNGHK